MTASDWLEMHLQVEQAVLSACTIDPEMIHTIGDTLNPLDFEEPLHQVIWGTMLDLRQQGEPIGRVALVTRLVDVEPRMLSYIEAMEKLNPISYHGPYYASLVKENAIKRRLVDGTREISEMALADPDAARAKLRELEQSTQPAAPLEDSTDSWEVLMDHLVGGGESDPPVMTGLPPLDAVMGGMGRGDLVIVGARPSIGKTSLATTIAHHVCLRMERPVAFVSLEMLQARILEKLLCLETDIPYAELTSGHLEGHALDRAGQGMERLRAAPIAVLGAQGLTAQTLRASVKRSHERLPLALVVVDYLQLVKADGKLQNREQEIASITAELKALALELECPVMALSQLNREPEHSPGREPRMSELRESGSQEATADAVLLLWRPNGEDEERRDPVQKVKCAVAKNRLGQTGTVTLGFRGSHMQFCALDTHSNGWGARDGGRG